MVISFYLLAGMLQWLISFTGLCAVKQYVQRKPSPKMLNIFVLVARSGLGFDSEVGQGKITLHTCEDEKSLDVGGAAVLKLAKALDHGSHIFSSKYFT